MAVQEDANDRDSRWPPLNELPDKYPTWTPTSVTDQKVLRCKREADCSWNTVGIQTITTSVPGRFRSVIVCVMLGGKFDLRM